jgi:hypothetical protein
MLVTAQPFVTAALQMEEPRSRLHYSLRQHFKPFYIPNNPLPPTTKRVCAIYDLAGSEFPTGAVQRTNDLNSTSTNAMSGRLFTSLATLRTRLPYPLVGPPHPISNIRPVLYEAPHIRQTQETSSVSSAEAEHPYALDEFSGACAKENTSITPTEKDEWVLRWTMMENDRKSHLFWLDVGPRSSQASLLVYECLPYSCISHLEQCPFQRGEAGSH